MAISPGPIYWNPLNQFVAYAGVSFTIGTLTSHTINVAVQLLNNLGQAVSGVLGAYFYLSANSDGHTLTPTATTSALVVGTNGVLLDIVVAGKAGWIISNTSGQWDINIIQTAGGTTYYLVVVMPSGAVVVSPVVQF